MLTVDYDKLGVQPGDHLLDLGCGFGRHAFEAARRGAEVVALDAGPEEVAQVRGTFAAMVEAGELPADHPATAVQGDALALPFPDGRFDRVIASEVLEHIPDDVAAMSELSRVLRPGGTMAVTVPRCGPEAINWALSDEYHDTPGGHVRIYRRSTLERRLSSAGLRAHRIPSRPRAPFALLVAALPRWPDQRHATRRCEAYHKVLVWDIVKAPFVTRTADRVLSPVDRQEPGALPDQAGRQRRRPVRLPSPTVPSRRAGTARADDARARVQQHDHRRGPHPEARSRRCPGVLSESDVLATAHAIADRATASDGMIPWFRGWPLRSRGTTSKAAMALTVCGLVDEAIERLPLVGRPTAPRWQLVQLLPGRRRQGPATRHQRLRLPGRRRLAPPPDHRRRRVPR